MDWESSPMEKTLVTWHDHAVTREDRQRLNGHRGCVVWFTGFSGSGKSTIANAVDADCTNWACTAFCWTATTCGTV